MKVTERKTLRKVFLTYEEIIKLLDLPYKVRYTEGLLPTKIGFILGVFGDEIRIWQQDYENFEDWRVELSIKELGNKLKLLKGEEIIGEDYIAYEGYEFIIDTTEGNLNKIGLFIDYEYNNLGITSKIFTHKKSKTRLKLNDWNKIRSQFQ